MAKDIEGLLARSELEGFLYEDLSSARGRNASAKWLLLDATDRLYRLNASTDKRRSGNGRGNGKGNGNGASVTADPPLPETLHWKLR